MKSVLMSIHPKWCELIASGKKTVEVRKTKPKLETPFKCYIYCTIGKDSLASVNGKVNKPNEIIIDLTKNSTIYELNGKVIGEFVCDKIKEITADNLVAIYFNNPQENTCLNDLEMRQYADGKNLFLWHISNLIIYDKPKELSEFLIDCKNCGKKFVGDMDCWKGCINGYRRITKPPQSWCYIEGE